jgi:hypothetical protein
MITDCIFNGVCFKAVASIEEKVNDSVTVDPLVLAATYVDYISKLPMLPRWIRF